MSSRDLKHDWEEVVGLNPQGDFEYQDEESLKILRGPVKQISIDEANQVVIELEWAGEMSRMGEEGFGKWSVSRIKAFTFPNLLVPYVVESTPEKGNRIRFGLSLIYIERLEGNTLNASRVEGLQLGEDSQTQSLPCADGGECKPDESIETPVVAYEE